MHLDYLESLQLFSGSSECSEPSLQQGVDGGEDGCEAGLGSDKQLPEGC